MAKVAEANTACINACQEIQDVEQALACMKQCEALHDLGIKGCAKDYRKCRGLPPLPPDLPVRIPPAEKDTFNSVGNALLSGGLGMFATSGALMYEFLKDAESGRGELVFVYVVCGLAGAALGAAGAAIDRAADPVDTNFKKKATPRFATPPLLTDIAETDISQDTADAINALLESQAKGIGIDRALNTSLDRAQGAWVAGQENYEEMQMETAREYAGELAQIIRHSIRLRRTALEHIRNDGIEYSVTKETAMEARGWIIDNGIPKEILNVIKGYGTNKKEREELERYFYESLFDINALVRPFPDVIAPRGLASAEENNAAALKAFSKLTS